MSTLRRVLVAHGKTYWKCWRCQAVIISNAEPKHDCQLHAESIALALKRSRKVKSLASVVWHRLKHATPESVRRFLWAFWQFCKLGFRFDPNAVADERYETCSLCDRLSFDADRLEQCGACGCYITKEKGMERAFSKLYYPTSATGGCPLGKWKR